MATRIKQALAAAVIAAVASGVAAMQSRPAADEDRSPAAVFRHARHDLLEEAAKSLQDGRLARSQPDFSRDRGMAIPAALLAQNLAKRQDEDPFADAYVRWQLVGFEGAALPELSDRQFDAFLASLPRMIENPRADRDLIDALAQAVKFGGTLKPSQEEEINKKLNGLAEESSRADAFNAPAAELRAWVLKQCEGSTPRRLVAMLEDIVSRVQAGRQAEDAKKAFEAALEKASRDRQFTPAQRTDVIDRIRQSLGRKRLLVAAANVRDHVLTVEYADAAIADFEVRRWAKLLEER